MAALLLIQASVQQGGAWPGDFGAWKRAGILWDDWMGDGIVCGVCVWEYCVHGHWGWA